MISRAALKARVLLYLSSSPHSRVQLSSLQAVRSDSPAPSSATIRSPISMFISNVAFTPGFSPTRKFSMKNFTQKKSPSPTPSRGSISHSHSCELWILSTLQGTSCSSEERQRIAQDLEMLNETEKDQLIEFIQAENGAAHCTLENNACKAFQCPAPELSFDRLEQDSQAMVDMWTTLYQTTIPALQSMLYPLKRHRSDFDIRKSVLSAFRDKVLLKMLVNSSRLAELEAMLFIVLLETHDETDKYQQFSRLAQLAMGLPKPSDSSSEPKSRARTLTSKRVTWHDDDGDGRKGSTHTA